MKTRMVMLALALMVALIAVVPASADGPKKDAAPAGKQTIAVAPAGEAGRSETGRVRFAAAGDASVPAPVMSQDSAPASKTVQVAGAGAQTGTESASPELFGSVTGSTRIFWGTPNSNVYVQGKTQSNIVQPQLYVSTYACKHSFNTCTNWGAANYLNVSWVTYTWHYVDSFLDWYYGRSYHFARDKYNQTTSFYTSNSGNY